MRGGMRGNMNDYILFDLDGTLTDPKEGITACVQYALSFFGMEEPDADELTPFIGPPLKESFMEFYGFDEEKAEAAVEKYRERFQDKGIFENRIYNGVPEMIRKLKGNHKRLAVASSKPTVFVKRILDHFEIGKYFDVIVGSELDGTRTDKAEVVAEALRRLYEGREGDTEEKKRNTVMVGDRKFDVAGAKAEGIVSVAVSYGYGPLDELKIAKPDYIVRSVEELEKLLLRGSGKEAKPQAKTPAQAGTLMSKTWFVLFPFLAYIFSRSLGFYAGSFLVANLAGALPKGLSEKLVVWDETGENLLGATGNGAAFILAAAYLVAGLVIWKFFAREEIGSAEKEVRLKHARLKSPAAYASMVLGVLGIAVGLNLLYELTGITNMSEGFKQAAADQYSAAFAVGLLVNGLIAPFSEELIFRGTVYNRLKKNQKYTIAIIVSALCFGIYHSNIVQGSYAFFLGCVIAWLYESFGHFYVPVIAHILSNMAAYLLTMTGAFGVLAANWWVCVVFLLAGAAGMYLCFRMKNAAGRLAEETVS